MITLKFPLDGMKLPKGYRAKYLEFYVDADYPDMFQEFWNAFLRTGDLHYTLALASSPQGCSIVFKNLSLFNLIERQCGYTHDGTITIHHILFILGMLTKQSFKHHGIDVFTRGGADMGQFLAESFYDGNGYIKLKKGKRK